MEKRSQKPGSWMAISLLFVPSLWLGAGRVGLGEPQLRLMVDGRLFARSRDQTRVWSLMDDSDG